MEEKKINREEGTLLASLLLAFYTASKEGFQLVEQFYTDQKAFDVNNVVRLVDKIILEQKASQ